MERFDLKTIQAIIKQTDDIQRFAIENYSTDPVLFDLIDHLARVAGMFGDVIEESLSGRNSIGDPQGYIKSKLGIAYADMIRYKKNLLGID